MRSLYSNMFVIFIYFWWALIISNWSPGKWNAVSDSQLYSFLIQDVPTEWRPAVSCENLCIKIWPFIKMSRRPIHFLFIQNFISSWSWWLKCRAQIKFHRCFYILQKWKFCSLILVINRPLIWCEQNLFWNESSSSQLYNLMNYSSVLTQIYSKR